MTAKIVSSGDLVSVFDFAPWYNSSCYSPDAQLSPTATQPIEIIKQYDPIFRGWATHRYSIFGSLLGFPPTPNGRQNEFFISAPVDLSGPNVDYDRVCYGSTLHNLPTLVDILVSGAAPVAPDSSAERFCRHSTFSGSGSFPSVVTDLQPQTVKENLAVINYVNGPIANNVNRRSYNGPFSWGLKHRTTNQYYWSWYGAGDGRCGISFTDLISSLSQAEFYFGNGTQFWRVSSAVSAVTISPDLFHFRVRTHCWLGGAYYGPPDCNYTWEYTYTFLPKKAVSSLYFDPLETTYWKLRFKDADLFTFFSVTCDRSDRPTTLPVLGPSDVSREVILNTPYAIPGSAGSEAGFYTHRPTCWTILRSFRRAVDTSWVDILPSATHSSVIALQTASAGTSTDVLQTLAKLPEYESLAPHIREAVDILSDIVKKRIDLLTVKEVIDLASTTMLQASFQWRPTLQLITTELPKIVEALMSFGSGKKIVVGRGRFDFDFQSGPFGRSQSHLTTRSKIVLDVSARALAASLLGFDRFGFLPKPSNLWDLVPWSFALNWLTGVGKDMQRMEYAILLATIPAYYVHTYTITSPFTPEELTSWSTGSPSEDAFSMKIFYRDVSHYSPSPRTSRFGFDLPANLPPLGSIAALLWQVLT